VIYRLFNWWLARNGVCMVYENELAAIERDYRRAAHLLGNGYFGTTRARRIGRVAQ